MKIIIKSWFNKFFSFLKNWEREIMTFIAIATFLALIFELGMLILQNQ